MLGRSELAKLEETVKRSALASPRKVLPVKVLAPAKDWTPVVTKPRATAEASGMLKV